MDTPNNLDFVKPENCITFNHHFWDLIEKQQERPEYTIYQQKQFQFAILTEDGISFIPTINGVDISKTDIAKAFIECIQITCDAYGFYYDKDLTFTVGFSKLVLSKNCLSISSWPDKPFDFWTLKEIEKQWLTFLKKKKVP